MNEILRRHSFSITFLIVLIGFFFLSGNDDDDIQQLSGFTMGTSYQFQLVDMPSDLTPEEISADVNELLMQLDTGIFSTFASSSELSRFNQHSANVPFIASTSLIEVLELAQEISIETRGAFDITVGPLVNLWGFGPVIWPVDADVPADAAIEAALNRVGFRHLQIDAARSLLVKTADITIDLSGIAKGYAVDRIAVYFDSLGVQNYFLEIGGELKMKGVKPGNESWVPAIEAPLDTAPQIYEIIYSRGETIAVAGSGDYRNYFEQDGMRYSHEIDPRTGRPVTHNLAAAYVIDQSAARADALATAYMILGVEEASEIAERNRQAAYFIYRDTNAEFGDSLSGDFRKYLSTVP
ncbi:MAG: FAD:protein FMN transferase ApbE [Gammaproteobacteria bacterium]|nr:FAD:protein FMN transferase ApbE [Gammaproteobacteria bacterium]